MEENVCLAKIRDWVSVRKFTNERYHLHEKGGHNPINVTHDANA